MNRFAVGLTAVGLFGLASVTMAAIPAQLKKIGEQTLGGEVAEIIPGKVKGGTEYLAALYDPPDGGTQVAVIRRVGNAYTVIYDEAACCTQNYDVRLTDLNQDGYPEVFYSGAGGGTGVSSYDFYLKDLRSKKLYHAAITVGNNSGRGSLTYDPPLLEPANQAFLNFMQPFIERSEGFKTTQLPPTLEERWTQQYARFTSGQWSSVQITPAPVALSSTDCERVRPYLEKPDPRTNVRLGDLTFVATFKGPVYGVNLKKKQCHVVYMPETYYDWIFPLKLLSNGSLALYDRSDARKVVFFNPKTNTLWR